MLPFFSTLISRTSRNLPIFGSRWSLVGMALVALGTVEFPTSASAQSLGSYWTGASGSNPYSNTGLGVSITGTVAGSSVTIVDPNYSNAGVIFGNDWTGLLPNDYLPIVSPQTNAVAVGYANTPTNVSVTFGRTVTNPVLVFNYVEPGTYNFGSNKVELIKFSGTATGSLVGNVLTITAANLSGGGVVGDGVAVRLLGVFQAGTAYTFSIDNTKSSVESAGFAIFLTIPNSSNTLTQLKTNEVAVRDMLTLRAAAVTNALSYDCASFGREGFCLSFNARQSSAEALSSGAGVLVGAYRLTPSVRIGAFIDQQVQATDPKGISKVQALPIFGGFIGYSADGKLVGLQAKVSFAMTDGHMQISRDPGPVNAEPGSGRAGLRSLGVSGEIGYGIALDEATVVTPYLALRYTDATRGGYTEASVPSVVDYPLSYDAYFQRATTVTTGLRLDGKLSGGFDYRLGLGVERDVALRGSDYTGNGIPGVGPGPNYDVISTAFDLPAAVRPNRLRPVGEIGLGFRPTPDQLVSANVSLRVPTYSSTPNVNVIVGYRLAF